MFFQADGWKEGRTGMTQHIVALRNVAKVPKNFETSAYSLLYRNKTFSTPITDKHDAKCGFHTADTRFYIPTNDLRKV